MYLDAIIKTEFPQHCTEEAETDVMPSTTNSFNCRCPGGDPMLSSNSYSTDGKQQHEEDILKTCSFHKRLITLKDKHISSLRPDTNMSQKANTLDTALLILKCQMHNRPGHRHNACCRKGSNSKQTKICRFNFERTMRPNTHLEGGTLMQKCRHGFMNPYNPFTLATARCNHDIRWLHCGADALG